jgi:hypothetical protein
VIRLKASPVSIQAGMVCGMGRSVVWCSADGFMFFHEALFLGEQRETLRFKFSVVERTYEPTRARLHAASLSGIMVSRAPHAARW